MLQKSEKFSPIDQIITASSGVMRIPMDNLPKWKLDEICDINDKLGDDMLLYRFNAEKTISWLKEKVAKVASVLASQRQKQTKATNNATVDSFDMSFQSLLQTSSVNFQADNDIPKDLEWAAHSESQVTVLPEDVKLALQIISENLTESTSKSLIESYDYSLNDVHELGIKKIDVKRKQDWEEELEVSSCFLK